jgi:hypothetical protein
MKDVDPRRIELLDEVTLAAMRRMTSDQKLRASFDLWRYARDRTEAAVRWQYPDFDDRAVRKEVARRILRGSG